MGFFHTSLSVDDIDSLKGLTEDRRVDGIFLVVVDDGNGFPVWYRYKQSSSVGIDPPRIIAPDDGIGRWFQFSGGGGGGGATIAGNILCTDEAPITGAGKVFEFTSYGTFLINVSIASGVAIASDGSYQSQGQPIIVHQWTEIPNAEQTGKIEPRVASLPQVGGAFGITVTSTNRWIILAARHPGGNSGNYSYDTAYCTQSGNTLEIVGF